MTIQLEQGRYYRTHDGRKVGPMQRIYLPDYHCWCASTLGHGYLWKDNGEPFFDGNAEAHTIVAGWPDEAGPVRLVTRLEIVPGTYGRVLIRDPFPGSVNVLVDGCLNVEELRAAATTLTTLADALDNPTPKET